MGLQEDYKQWYELRRVYEVLRSRVWSRSTEISSFYRPVREIVAIKVDGTRILRWRYLFFHSVLILWGINKGFDVFSSILRSIEFPSIGPGVGGPSGETSKSLEMLLLERTKVLQQAENVALKAAVDLQGNSINFSAILQFVIKFHIGRIKYV